MYEILENIDRLFTELGKQIDDLKIYLTVNPESGLRSIGRVDHPVEAQDEENLHSGSDSQDDS